MKYTTFDEILARFTPEERAGIKRRSAIMSREVDNAREVRESVVQCQAEVAAKLGLEPKAMTRLERRADRYVVTLRRLVKAMGGHLDVVVTLPGKDPARIIRFREAEVWPYRERKRAATVIVAEETPATQPNGVDVPRGFDETESRLELGGKPGD